MTADRELLELSAKAAGIELMQFEPEDGCFEPAYRTKDGYWNPLTDDGDALRLRNRIQAMVYSDGNSVTVLCDNTMKPRVEISLAYGRDLPKGYSSHASVDAATRRAIVRAAAAIGEAL